MDIIDQLTHHFEGSKLIEDSFLNLNASDSYAIKGGNVTYLFLHIALLMRRLKMMHPQKSIIFCCKDRDEALYSYDTAKNVIGVNEVHFLSDSFHQPGNFSQVMPSNLQNRQEVIYKVSHRQSPHIIITYPEALMEGVVEHLSLVNDLLIIQKGEKLDFDFFLEIMDEYQYERVDFVYEPGQYSLRGSIIDIFTFINELPFRIQLNISEQIEDIRTFDPESQLSVKNIAQVKIIPNTFTGIESKPMVSIFDALKGLFYIWIHENDIFDAKVSSAVERINFYKNDASKVENEKTINFLSHFSFFDLTQLEIQFEKQITVFYSSYNEPKNRTVDFNIKIQPHPIFNKDFKLLVTNLAESKSLGLKTFFSSENPKQLKRMESILLDLKAEVNFQPIIGSFKEGFIDIENKIQLLTDHQVFQRYHKYSYRKGFTREQALTVKNLNALEAGDFVTHIDHGVGKFSGLQIIENNGVKQESVRIFYKNNDILYVGINSLHKLSKYVGKEGVEPQLSKLGTDAWKNLVNRTKRKVKDIASSLIKFYAQRKASKGFAFSQDGYLQNELEASFIYEDTPDQEKATLDVKADMEKPYPMDRLICGDVGFGKTEIAVRAAFKAINDGKQVAILVPTTILALQHYHTFSERLNAFGVFVDYINRFKSTKEKKVVYQDIKSGKVDLIIGTHALLNQEISFKDLGLLIIDEEQKFGVSSKEKIRQLKVNVDTLIMTATPIPRTLQFSLMAARDLSIIRTPPPNRQPINTELLLFNEKSIIEIIENEVYRGGQVFFVHDRVKNLSELALMISSLLPDISIATAHGQMDSKNLETTLLDFIEGKFDVLVSTNIIETGLDIPNANTIIINNAHHVGLSDLHQLRGRVGRSNKKAYCYLIAPPPSLMTDEARKRLKTIVDFSDLGSGFEIAMRDLDIRGSGNLLGAEQSGFISEIGYDSFQKILEEAIEELKEDDFKEVFHEEIGNRKNHVKDVIIETDKNMLLPEEYIPVSAQRLRLYNEMNAFENSDSLNLFLEKIIDQYGPLPEEALELINAIQLRWVLRKLGIERLIKKGWVIKAFFTSNPQSAFYNTETFQNIMIDISMQDPQRVNLKKTIKNLILEIKRMKTMEDVRLYFDELLLRIA